MGLDAKDGADQKVTVQEVNFEKPAAAPAANSGPLAAVTSGGAGLMDGLRQFLAVGAAIAIFVVFLGMLKKQKAESAAEFQLAEEKTAAPQNLTALTPDMLNNLIQQKPENVSQALKNWVSAGEQKR